ncbi:MAG TPA: cytochrome b, partial [Paracoccaceae bacterium]|nr:cytochrome b [Paracoccaceae bacterium]
MSLSNTESLYGSVTRAFHWLTALLVLTLIAVALIADELPYETSEQLARKAWMFSLHKTLGVSVFFISVLRILWALAQPKPDPLHPERRVETFVAEAAHWLLYGSLVLAPLSGWIHHAASEGFAPIWWPLGQSLPLVPKSESVSAFFGGLHWVFTNVMIFTILAHIAGALKHHLIDKDNTLRRMLGRADGMVAPAPESRGRQPIAAALGVWAIVLAIGAGQGVYAPHGGDRAAAATLEEVASDWTVTDGTIE